MYIPCQEYIKKKVYYLDVSSLMMYVYEISTSGFSKVYTKTFWLFKNVLNNENLTNEFFFFSFWGTDTDITHDTKILKRPIVLLNKCSTILNKLIITNFWLGYLIFVYT